LWFSWFFAARGGHDLYSAGGPPLQAPPNFEPTAVRSRRRRNAYQPKTATPAASIRTTPLPGAPAITSHASSTAEQTPRPMGIERAACTARNADGRGHRARTRAAPTEAGSNSDNSDRKDIRPQT